MSNKFKLQVFPLEREVECQDDQTIFTALSKSGIHLNQSCGACASCGECIIKVIEPKQNVHKLSRIEFAEQKLLGNVYHITGERLACQTRVLADIEIDISNHISLQDTENTSNTKLNTSRKRSIFKKEN